MSGPLNQDDVGRGLEDGNLRADGIAARPVPNPPVYEPRPMAADNIFADNQVIPADRLNNAQVEATLTTLVRHPFTTVIRVNDENGQIDIGVGRGVVAAEINVYTYSRDLFYLFMSFSEEEVRMFAFDGFNYRRALSVWSMLQGNCKPALLSLLLNVGTNIRKYCQREIGANTKKLLGNIAKALQQARVSLNQVSHAAALPTAMYLNNNPIGTKIALERCPIPNLPSWAKYPSTHYLGYMRSEVDGSGKVLALYMAGYWCKKFNPGGTQTFEEILVFLNKSWTSADGVGADLIKLVDLWTTLDPDRIPKAISGASINAMRTFMLERRNERVSTLQFNVEVTMSHENVRSENPETTPEPL